MNRLLSFLIIFFSLQTMVFAQGSNDTINVSDAKGNKQGYWKKTENGIVKYEGHFKDNAPTGTFKYFYPNGKIKAISEYSSKGTKAKAKLFYETGILKAEGNYLNEKKDSLWKFYNDKGILLAEENYSGNKKNGTWKIYYPTGKVSEETVWKDDMRNGISKEYFEDGKIKKESNYVNDQLEGPYKVYFSNGLPSIVGKYQKNLKVGDWAEYLETGEIKVRETYRGGRLSKQKRENGVFTDYYPKDIPKETYTYKAGLKHGDFKQFYEAGEWKREFIKGEDGYPDEFKETLEGQKIQTTGTYKNDKLHGKVTHYNLDGSVKKTEEYQEGNLVK